MNNIKILSEEYKIPPEKTACIVRMLESGDTIPFIARYRKESTAGLKEDTLYDLAFRLEYLKKIDSLRKKAIERISKQGKMTAEIYDKIQQSLYIQDLKDVLRSFGGKRMNKARIAREKGLEELARLIMEGTSTDSEIELAAEAYIGSSSLIVTTAEALSGACDIAAEIIAGDPELKELIRSELLNFGEFVCKGRNPASSVFFIYNDFREKIAKIPAHRILAINRGERKKLLKVALVFPKQKIISGICQKKIGKTGSIINKYYLKSIHDSCDKMLFPSVSRRLRLEATARAEKQAFKIFSCNLKSLLMQPPLHGHNILGIDPGYRSGCKFAVIDTTGKYLESGIIYPNDPHNKKDEALQIVLNIVEKHQVSVAAIGNKTASRETALFIEGLISLNKLKMGYVLVNEAGASVYSASPTAAREFADLDLTHRSAVSIARRLLDPLAELIKIEPRAIGIGQYQHDLDIKLLEKQVKNTVETCVNSVGVNLNTASVELLQHIAGLNRTLAASIVAAREKNGEFKQRKELLSIPGIGPRIFRQCAGFVRVLDGAEPLDNTSVHPESYDVAEKVMVKTGVDRDKISLLQKETKAKLSGLDLPRLSEDLQVGLPTLQDIIDSLIKPGLDPREELPPVLIRKDVLGIDDVCKGMVLEGIVSNVTDFGVFVDIGTIKEGFIHLSEMSAKYIRHPLDIVHIGDRIRATVLNVCKERSKISLSMKDYKEDEKI